MNRKISLGLAIALMAIAAAITFIISTSYSMNIYNNLVADVQQRAEMYQKLEQIDSYVRAYYDGTIDEDKLIEALAEGYISILDDAEADYMTAQEYALYKEHQSGTHLGIGVYTREDGGYPTVTEVIANSPASISGISVGESVVEINGQSCLDLGYQEACEQLRSAAGTQLELTVRSAGVDRKVVLSTLQMTVGTVRTQVYGDLGYIKVSTFNEKTYQQFMAAYSSLRSQNVAGIIIDLRNNSGEVYDSAVNILTAMLPRGTPVAMNIAKDGVETVYETATGSQAPLVPICTIVNEKTKGPAELFAAALNDSLKSPVVGMTTAGDADYFETYPLYDGTAILLPISTLKTPNYEIEGVGVKPTYEASQPDGDSDEQLAQLDETSDNALRRAIEVVTSQIPN